MQRMSYSLFSFLAAAATVGGFAAVVGASRLVSARAHSRKQKRLFAGALLLIYGAALAFRPSGWVAIDLAGLAGAVGGVVWVEGGFPTPASVAVFLAVAGIVDYLSMSAGVSKVIVERYRAGTGNLLVYLGLVVPVRGHAIPVVGLSDLFIAGAAAVALVRLKLRPVAVMGTMVAGFLSALAYGLWRGGTPAVPFLAVAVALLVWRHSSRSAVRGSPGTPASYQGCRSD
jgi:hypothetical protein